MRSLPLALAIVLVLLLPPTLAAQQEAAAPPDVVRVVVFPLSAFVLGQPPGDFADVLRDMIISEISAVPRLRTFERARVDELYTQRKATRSGQSFSDADAVELGKLLGSEYAFTGGISIAGGVARLDLRILDTETGAVVKAFKPRTRPEQFQDVVTDIVTELARLPLKARAAPVQVPVRAAFLYSRGLDYEKRGERSRAAEMYRESLRIFPGWAAAQAALARVDEGE